MTTEDGGVGGTRTAGGLGEAPPAVPVTIERVLGAAIMGLLCLITLGNVLARYFTNVSFAFTEEYSVALMVLAVLVGTAAAFASDRHIRLTLLTERLPLAHRRTVELGVLALSLGLFGLLAWLSGLYVWDEYRFEVMSPGLGVPQWRYTVALPLCCVVICLRIAGRMVRVARAAG